MKKIKTSFVCNECGWKYPTWQGRCSNCGAYNSIVEEIEVQIKNQNFLSKKSSPTLLQDLTFQNNDLRFSTGYKNLDESLGGGLISGQVVLISGEPGIGKSTLLLKISSNLSKTMKVLYISAEESLTQIYTRAKRIRIDDSRVYILAETSFENILDSIDTIKPDFIILDSIQTIYSQTLESSAGSVSQVKYVAGKIVELSKSKGIISVIVGQVNKEGMIAGPKVLEHLVDTVAQFEGEKGYGYRVLRVLKNRFGSAGEIAVFNMTDRGMEEIQDPSSFFLSEKPLDTSGSVIFPYTEGSKPVLIEVQALVSKTFYPVPQRRSQGFDINKLSIITAIMEKYLRINLKDKDVFVNIVGGIKVDDPAIDLPVMAAIYSSYIDKPVSSDVAFFGEVGLTGEVRGVYFSDIRIKECQKMGFKNVVANVKQSIDGMNIVNISNINQLRELLG